MILPDICTNVAECAKLSKEKATITEELEGLYEKWERTCIMQVLPIFAVYNFFTGFSAAV